MVSISAIVVFDIDGVIRDVSGSYRRALADTVEYFTNGAYRPSQVDIDTLKSEGIWNNDWEASRELICRYFEAQGLRSSFSLDYEAVIAFFQSRYRGADLNNPDHWTGYICQEPLLLQSKYLEQLTQAGIAWGFFSGATRGSASYVLERRLGLQSPVLVAMEDAPGKPDPIGLFNVVHQLESQNPSGVSSPVIYVGDTVADMQTVERARLQETSEAKTFQPKRPWIGVGVLPPHAQTPPDYARNYATKLQQAGAAIVLETIEQLTLAKIQQLTET
ncbi:MAG: TIGR01548 family HAD-type hydrolase [Cyanobacteria bacterium CRU_2_1]|nr:TIGR01548 family HAD-type hydrolase [Cyanobacteria bacterium CRU_2_1]